MTRRGRRGWMGLMVVMALVGCRKAPPSPAGPVATSPEPRERLQIAVIPKGTTHYFWLSVKAGAEKAGQEEGVEILWKGPAKETEIDKQKAIVEDFITQGVDGIVMAACDTKALVPTVQKALDSGIPVVTIDSGIDPDVSYSFIATDNVAAAREAARKLAELIGEEGEVGLIPFFPGAQTSQERERGFKEGIARYPKIRLVATLYSQSDVAKGMQVTEDMLTAHPNLKGIFAANEPGAIGAAQVIKARGLVGKVKLVAFDAAEAEVQALREGVIQALIVQNPFRMGYEGVKTVLKVIRGEKVEKRIDTGVTIVTQENLDSPEVQQLLTPPAAGA